MSDTIRSLEQFDDKDVVFVGVRKGRSFSGFKSFLEQHARPRSIVGVNKQPGEEPLNFLLDYDSKTTVFVKNEGVPGDLMPVPFISPTQLFFEAIKGRGATVIGVTGTKGKTTTTSLIAAILKAAGKKVIVAGNIGDSVFNHVDEVDAETFLVLELSSHQLADLHQSPNIGVITNLYEDHLDYYGTLEAYWEAKHSIVRFMTSDDHLVYNADFPLIEDWLKDAACIPHPLDKNGLIDMSHTGLIGDHNRLNALMARAVARLCGVDDETSQRVIDSFVPVKHRLQPVKTVDGKIFIDDAIASQPEAAIAGIKAVAESVGPIGCLLLGGQDRGYDFGELMKTAADNHIPCLVLFPDTVEAMKKAMPSGYSPQTLETSDMAEAVRWAFDNAPDKSVVMLSNGAPSYSIWKDFEEKGDLFQEAVNSL